MIETTNPFFRLFAPTFLAAPALAAALVLAAALGGTASPAAAQPRSVVQDIQRHGQTDRRTAQEIARQVHTRLTQNGASGGTEYDELRQVLGTAMFGGPGGNRSEYDRRIAEVVRTMSRGLHDVTLRAFFTPGAGVSLRCAELFGIPMQSCDALIAAASGRTVDFPYLAPSDGSELGEALRSEGVSNADAGQIVSAVHRVMLSVPASVDGTSTGRTLDNMLRACPGRLPDEETRVRVWHAGPTPATTRCLARALGRAGRQATQAVQQVFGMPQSAAVAYLRWAHGQGGASASRGPDRNQLMTQAQQLYLAQRFAEAARVYEQVTTADPSFAPGHQALAVSRMRAGDVSGAATAYRSAARLAPRDAGIQVGLARALTRLGDRQGAAAAYQMALAIDPSHAVARQELAALSGQPAPQQYQAAPQQYRAQPQPRYAAPQPAPQPAQDPTTALRQQARAHFDQRQYAQAAADYTRLTQMDPRDPTAWGGLGASHLAQRNAQGAVQAYRIAAQLDSRNANIVAGLGAAEMAAGNQPGARAAFQQALSLDPSHRGAQHGLSQLGPPQPTLPETPPRAEIVREMGRFENRIAECAPETGGTVRFRIVARGTDGMVSEVEMVGPMAGTPPGECMTAHLRGARFPRFTRATLEIVYPFELRGTGPQGSGGGGGGSAEPPPENLPNVDHIVDGILDD